MEGADIPAACTQSPENLLSGWMCGTPAGGTHNQESIHARKEVSQMMEETADSPVGENLQVPAVTTGQPQCPFREDVRTLGDREVK